MEQRADRVNENLRKLTEFFVSKARPPMKFDTEKLNVLHLLHLKPNPEIDICKSLRNRAKKLLKLNNRDHLKLPIELKYLGDVTEKRALNALNEFLRSDNLCGYLADLKPTFMCRKCGLPVLSGSTKDYDENPKEQCKLFFKDCEMIKM